MEETTNSTVSGRVIVDDHRFERCVFANAEVVFTGGTPPAFIDCAFQNSRLVFEGPADSTLQYLRALAGASAEFRAVVVSLIPELIAAPAPAPAND